MVGGQYQLPEKLIPNLYTLIEFFNLVQNTRLGLLPSMTVQISVTTCDAHAMDHVVRFPGLLPPFLYTASDQGGRPGNEATTFNIHYF